ncbi:acyl-CoA carboxylase subunit beta, partial [Steroidobacter sp.]|uniref:acyl-CoA carboxylase subunit beta n=1 Tax=Steroidobacter sp. TaxID=1978227 RepID=UPI001A49AE32
MNDQETNPPEGWAPELGQIEDRRRASAEMGGADKVAIQHAKGKLTVLERIDQLLDAGTFREMGALAGTGRYTDDGQLHSFTPANSRFGWGCIDERRVVVSGDDFTVRGGAADAAIHEKLVQAEQMANEFKMPIVRLLDGSGGGGSVKTLEMTGHTYVPEMPGWDWVVANLSTVPVVALGLGPIAGLGAARLVSSHYSVLSKQGQMFAAGPSLVAAIGQNVTKEELGGAGLHAQIGSVDDLADNEADAFAKARRFLSYLPCSVDALPTRIPSQDPPQRVSEELDSIVPRDRRQAYKMRRVLECVLDAGSFFEIGRHWGRASITGFARLDGWPVAVIASDPNYYGGAWTADTAQKLVRFIELAETFHLPVVHLVDIPGFMVGLQAERAGTLRHGARALASVYQATVPWCTVIVRKAFGVAGAGMCNPT